jgi:hypothetical protein
MDGVYSEQASICICKKFPIQFPRDFLNKDSDCERSEFQVTPDVHIRWFSLFTETD